MSLCAHPGPRAVRRGEGRVGVRASLAVIDVLGLPLALRIQRKCSSSVFSFSVCECDRIALWGWGRGGRWSRARLGLRLRWGARGVLAWERSKPNRTANKPGTQNPTLTHIHKSHAIRRHAHFER